MEKATFLKHFTMWKMLRVFAIITLIVIILQVMAEAYSLNQEIVWVKDKLLTFMWNSPPGGSDHYRVEILKTDLLSDPVTTSLSYAYSNEEKINIELLEDHSYSLRIQSVSQYGALSGFSQETPLYIFDVEKAGTTTGIADDAQTPLEFSLSQNYPNPFNNATTINYQIPYSSADGGSMKVRLMIFNALGQVVRDLVDEDKMTGAYSVVWDGRNDRGVNVASGNYIYQLIAGNHKMAKKMIYIK